MAGQVPPPSHLPDTRGPDESTTLERTIHDKEPRAISKVETEHDKQPPVVAHRYKNSFTIFN